MEYKKRIITKFVIFIILIIAILALNIIRTVTYSYVFGSLSSKKYFNMHYYYTFNFFKYLEDENYEKAFEMLTEDCKINDFGNDINKFKSIVSVLELSGYKAEDRYDYKEVDINYENNYVNYVDLFKFKKKEIYVYTYQYSDFEYKIQLCVIDGEGL